MELQLKDMIINCQFEPLISLGLLSTAALHQRFHAERGEEDEKSNGTSDTRNEGSAIHGHKNSFGKDSTCLSLETSRFRCQSSSIIRITFTERSILVTVGRRDPLGIFNLNNEEDDLLCSACLEWFEGIEDRRWTRETDRYQSNLPTCLRSLVFIDRGFAHSNALSLSNSSRKDHRRVLFSSASINLHLSRLGVKSNGLAFVDSSWKFSRSRRHPIRWQNPVRRLCIVCYGRKQWQ